MKMDMKNLKKMFSAKNLGKNSENLLIALLVVVLLVLVVVYVMKNREGFEAKKSVVVYFFRRWCGYCRRQTRSRKIRRKPQIKQQYGWRC